MGGPRANFLRTAGVFAVLVLVRGPFFTVFLGELLGILEKFLLIPGELL